MENSLKTADRRNYGIDLFRLFSMLMIVILHIVGKGIDHTSYSGIARTVCVALNTFSLIGVDCFAIITGYVCYSESEKPYKYRRIIPIWFEVLFWNVIITLAFFIFKPSGIRVGVSAVLKSFFPVTFSAYWYFTAYALLFFVIPLLNRMIRACSKRAVNLTALGIFVFITYANFIRTVGSTFSLNGGCSPIWLMICYFIGAWLKKCAVPEKISSGKALIGAAVIVAFNVLFRLLSPFGPAILNSYISPTIVAVAVLLFIVFCRMEIKSNGVKKLIAFTAPAAFGVYLVHTHPLIFENYIKGGFTWLDTVPPALMLFAVIGTALALFLVCLALSELRRGLFTLLRIDKLADNLGGLIGKAEKFFVSVAVKLFRAVIKL